MTRRAQAGPCLLLILVLGCGTVSAGIINRDAILDTAFTDSYTKEQAAKKKTSEIEEEPIDNESDELPQEDAPSLLPGFQKFGANPQAPTAAARLGHRSGRRVPTPPPPPGGWVFTSSPDTFTKTTTAPIMATAHPTARPTIMPTRNPTYGHPTKILKLTQHQDKELILAIAREKAGGYNVPAKYIEEETGLPTGNVSRMSRSPTPLPTKARNARVKMIPHMQGKLSKRLYATRGRRESLDKAFYCPKEFIPARPGGFRDESSKQGCCILDKSIALMEVIYLMRTCTLFENLSSRWGLCDANAIRTLHTGLRACCVDSLFKLEKIEQSCMQTIAEPLHELDKAVKPLFKECTGMAGSDLSGVPKKSACAVTEVHIAKIVKALHQSAEVLYSKEDITKESQQFMDITKHDTMGGIVRFLKNHGGKIPADAGPDSKIH
jgi:hypothetical protein